MKKTTIQCFLLIFIFLFGWQLQAGEKIKKEQFENIFQKQLIDSNTENNVLDELTAFLHDFEFRKEEIQEREMLSKNYLEDFACQSPIFVAYVNCDVDNFIIMVTVEVTDLGSASTVVINDSANSPTQELTEPGSVTFGPYPYDEDITFTVSDEEDEDCNSTEVVNSDSCPPIPCQMAEPFCSDGGLFFENNSENGRGETPDDMPNLDYGCLSTQPNPTWHFLKIDEPGDLTIHITQNTEFDDDGNAIGTTLDVDFLAWGPFDSLNEACNNLTVENQVPRAWPSSDTSENHMGYGCSYSAAPEEDFGVVDAESGDIYVLLLTNYSGDPGYIQVTQTAGEGSTDCSIVIENEILACHGDEVELESEIVSEIDVYIWYEYDLQIDEYVPYEDEFDDTLIVTESGKYKVEVFDAEGDTSTEIFSVVVSPEPQLDNLEEQMSLCGVESLILDGTVFNSDDYGGIQYRWKDEDDAVIGSSATLEVTEIGIYTLEITTATLNSDGSESNELCVTIIEIDVTAADFTVDVGEDQILCNVDFVELEAEIIGDDGEGASFVWTNQEDEVIGDAQTVEVFETGQYTVEVDVGGCVNTASVYVEMNFSPEFDLGDDIVTCSLEDILIEVELIETEVTETMTFIWHYNGELVEDNNDMFISPADYGYGIYSVTVFDGDPDCSTTHEITVSEVEDFGVELTANNDLTANINYCEGDEATVSDYEITFTASPYGVESGDFSYTWYLNGTVIEGATGNTYTAVYGSVGVFDDEYMVEVEFGSCSATASLTTHINYGPFEHPCKISEGISPGNNDGYNDNLDLTFISDRSGIAKFTVYNRYGTKVYDKADYVNEWRGQDKSGNQLVTGTYYYVLEMKNEDPVFGKVEKGWIYVNQSIN